MFKNTVQEINYFEIVFKLRFYEDKLRKFDLNENVELFLSEIMSYIFSNITLKAIFNEQLSIFLKYDNDDNYRKMYLAEYEKVKSLTQEIALKKNKQISYLNKCQVKIFRNKKLIDTTFDMPIIYLYSSVINLLGSLENKKRDTFKYFESIKDFYKTIHDSYGNIIIPENIEFYCALVFSYRNIINKYNNQSSIVSVKIFVLTSIFYVLTKLHEIITIRIDEKCFNKNGIILKKLDEQDKSYILSYRKDGMFYINNEMFQLSDSLLVFLKEITFVGNEQINITIKPTTRNTYINRINNLAKKQIGQKILEFNKIQKKTYPCKKYYCS